MNIKLIAAIITISLALVFYTIGVFSERKAGSLRLKQILFFGMGLVFDTTGTTIMSSIASSSSAATPALHLVTGVAAIVLMAFHFLWAAYVLGVGSQKSKTNFHKFSLVVWMFWLISYVAGLVMGMTS
ncbi:HsmA family protein [Lentilactobacillus kefiri]|nr:HsmA family protein [Lentilactobacillus kefiri]MCJ2161383.1 TIGR03987 family protein [Lentilactobacillus kefiri]MCP9368659.1 TIGR03987 family protein [Lentilactobacillus kefiri]MDH5107984.1 HsmA family protein [Lentilactobacillus kefiri]MDM7492348.1 HsmA family protein [Lentilactobacillus kefiri]PAK60022.1 TIGR03987 family protein [Lentilactobacillus kefiri]